MINLAYERLSNHLRKEYGIPPRLVYEIEILQKPGKGTHLRLHMYNGIESTIGNDPTLVRLVRDYASGRSPEERLRGRISALEQVLKDNKIPFSEFKEGLKNLSVGKLREILFDLERRYVISHIFSGSQDPYTSEASREDITFLLLRKYPEYGTNFIEQIVDKYGVDWALEILASPELMEEVFETEHYKSVATEEFVFGDKLGKEGLNEPESGYGPELETVLYGTQAT